MSFSLALVVVDAQNDSCDPSNGSSQFTTKHLTSLHSPTKILPHERFRGQDSDYELTPQAPETMRHDHNAAEKSVIKTSNTKHVSEHEI